VSPEQDAHAAPGEQIVISEELAIPTDELRFRFSRAGGPGGQHVNRSETRVELLFDVAHSPSLTEAQRARLLHRLANVIDGGGVLRVVAASARSQLANRQAALERLRELLRAALRQRKRRLPTRPGLAAQQARLEAKRARSRIKQARRPVQEE